MRFREVRGPLLVGLGVACSSCNGSSGEKTADETSGEETSGASSAASNTTGSTALVSTADSVTTTSDASRSNAGTSGVGESELGDNSITSASDGQATSGADVSDGASAGLSDGSSSMAGAGATDGETSGSTSSGATGDVSTLDTSSCRFQISAALSPQISTVGIVNWSVDLTGLTQARIEFSLTDPQEGEVNIGGSGEVSTTEGRALLLGLKPGRGYTYRLVVTNGQTVCASLDQTLSTEGDPGAPSITHALGESDAPRANGFILTCGYGGNHVSVLDTDGAVVWWTSVPYTCSRALMDWDGKYMWSMAANPATAGAANTGKVTRVQMDGSGLESITGIEYSHHDFTVLPDGGTAFLIGEPGVEANSVSNLVERAKDGTFTTVARLDGEVLIQTSTNYHANALHYYAHDDSYTVSDLNVWTIVKLTRAGERVWGTSPSCTESSSQCIPVPTTGNHGHQLLENGNLLYFGHAEDVSKHAAYEYSLNLDGSPPTATLEWSYAPGLRSDILGDVQRLPNGNTLVTFSVAKVIHEVSPLGKVVQSFESAGQLGYSMFRTSLYGPPQMPASSTALRASH